MTNKERALAFLELLIAGSIDEAYERFIAPDARHHNAYYPGDMESLKQGMKDNEAQFPGKVFEVQHALEDGDLVATHSRLRMSAEAPALGVLHLFRFKDGLVVEMWDLGQQEPADMPNENGMF